MAGDLLVESDGGVIRLTLNRPERRNALSLELLTELEHALESIAADTTARVVVLGAARPGVLLGPRPGGDGRADRGGISRAVRRFARG